MRISDWSSDVCSSDLFGLRQLRSPALRYSPPMPNSSLRTLVFALACLVAAGTAHAQLSSANSSIADAISAAERGQPVDAARFATDPLYGWLAYATLRRNIDTLPTDKAQSFPPRPAAPAVVAPIRGQAGWGKKGTTRRVS